MNGVPIKFRGKRDFGDGEYVYGYYVPWSRSMGAEPAIGYGGGVFWFKGVAGILDEKTAKLVAVVENSVAQLIGYDAAGKEIYEGDEVEAYRTFGLRTAEELAARTPSAVGKLSLGLKCVLIVGEYTRSLANVEDYQFLKKGRRLR